MEQSKNVLLIKSMAKYLTLISFLMMTYLGPLDEDNEAIDPTFVEQLHLYVEQYLEESGWLEISDRERITMIRCAVRGFESFNQL